MEKIWILKMNTAHQPSQWRQCDVSLPPHVW